MFESLPDLAIDPGIRKGRVPKEGYQRGWGLQYGDLRRLIQEEDLFRRAEAATGIPSWVSFEKRANLYLLMTRFLPSLAHHHIVEFGSYKGGNALFMALVMREVAPDAKIYALDTYEGMPATDASIDAHTEGNFADTALEEFEARIEQLQLSNLVVVKGLFQDTFPVLEPDVSFGLAHIDADIYSAVKYAQEAVWPRMAVGGYVVYDDADVSSCIGATEAVEELIRERGLHSEQIWPHFVFRVGL